MQLESIAVRLRRRNAWEAMDLGLTMLRAWAGPAYRTWAATYWLIGLIVLAALWPWGQFAYVVLWWLKPVFDRALLFAFSRSVFGTPTGVRDAWRALPQLFRAPGLLSSLTWRRFSPSRSFLLPVGQVEEQRGAAARARCRLLARRTGATATWLTFVCANLVPVLAFSLIFVTDLLIPGDASPLLKDLFNELGPAQKFALNLFLMAAESLVEPLYVASGFALYLNRRSELEGWDIELAFRALAARRRSDAAAAAPGAAAMAVVACVGLLLFTAAPDQAIAATPAPASPSKQTVTQVLADPIFGHETEEMRWRPIPEKDKDASKQPAWLRSLLSAVEFISRALRGLVWVGAIILAALLVYLVIRYSEGWRPTRKRAAPPPEFLFGLDVRPSSLPADVAAAAQAAIAAGRIAEALSLLYRGALVALIQQLQVEFRAGDTEGDCLRRVAGRLPEDSRSYFAELLAAWRDTAYAHAAPPAASLEALCRDWPRHFGVRASPP